MRSGVMSYDPSGQTNLWEAELMNSNKIGMIIGSSKTVCGSSIFIELLVLILLAEYKSETRPLNNGYAKHALPHDPYSSTEPVSFILIPFIVAWDCSISISIGESRLRVFRFSGDEMRHMAEPACCLHLMCSSVCCLWSKNAVLNISFALPGAWRGLLSIIPIMVCRVDSDVWPP